MRKGLIWTLALAATAAVAVTAVAYAAKPIVIRAGNLIFTVNGDFAPKKLPKNKLAPVKLNVKGELKTANGAHPPALKEVVVDFDKNAANDVKGLPVCTQGKLVAQDTTSAQKACKARSSGKARPKSWSNSPNRNRSRPKARWSSSTAAKKAARSPCSSTPT